jgi:hypothetical protein
MSLSPLEPVRWSRRRWVTTVTAILVGQIALVLYLAESPHDLTRAVRSRTALYLAADNWSAKQLADMPTLDDPTLFALPSIYGFSGKAWLRFPLLDYEMSHWTEPPPYLVLNPDQLGSTFSSFAATNEPPAVEFVAKPVADLLTLQLSIPPLNLRTASECRVEGSLKNRRLLDPPKLPSWPQEELLANTVVQLLVNQLGDTLSTALLASSTSKTADEYALKSARSVRFEPVNSSSQSGYSSGRLVFQWHTIPMPETNTASIQP